MLVCIYVCGHPVSLSCALSWSSSTDGFPTMEENFLNGTQDKQSVPRREPAVVQAITCDCGKEASSSAMRDLNPWPLASLAPCSSQVC